MSNDIVIVIIQTGKGLVLLNILDQFRLLVKRKEYKLRRKMNLEIYVQGEAKASPLLLLLYQSKLSTSSLCREQSVALVTFEALSSLSTLIVPVAFYISQSGIFSFIKLTSHSK
ncbi:uncharacterized protein Gasu_39150 [Galdieria sulphuraria]|uniref:Uncharacterized protein n=1 Tax=Galdieria sulphuraria TaxID=130081 RepID=M2VZ00_GALSU|nr:uncharacterized protein Gasu_39150 [Galdieria sulphuraria]EME28536.1 hypothetical protein Gasu_39150 [Galdieria sulphuraria]|eukprot:XP_005705056.1 hypothetical protein Gasu_39150 [Galdieria sulphuraria]